MKLPKQYYLDAFIRAIPLLCTFFVCGMLFDSQLSIKKEQRNLRLADENLQRQIVTLTEHVFHLENWAATKIGCWHDEDRPTPAPVLPPSVIVKPRPTPTPAIPDINTKAYQP